MAEIEERMPQDAESRRARSVELRRWLHRHPELSFREVETADRIVAELNHLGIPSTYRGPGSGVIGRIDVDPKRPTVALRAELDHVKGRLAVLEEIVTDDRYQLDRELKQLESA